MYDPLIEKTHIRNSLTIPLILISIIILGHLLPLERCYGIQPRKIEGISGIVLSPFLHADWNHLWSNIVPFFLFSAGLFYYLPNVFFRIFITSTILTNILVWFTARNGCHIGASGTVYFFAAFLLTLAALKKDRTLGAFSLIILFLYGSMAWGVFPLKKQISWESHAIGAVFGIAYAFIFRKNITWNSQNKSELADEYNCLKKDSKSNETINQANSDENRSYSEHNVSIDNSSIKKIEYHYKSKENK